MTLADAVVVATVAYCFSHWVRYNVKTMRGAYYSGVGLMFVFYIGLAEHCAG